MIFDARFYKSWTIIEKDHLHCMKKINRRRSTHITTTFKQRLYYWTQTAAIYLFRTT